MPFLSFYFRLPCRMENEAAKKYTEGEEGPAFFFVFLKGERGVGRGKREAAVFGEKGRGPVMLLEAWLGFLPFFLYFFLPLANCPLARGGGAIFIYH